MRIGIDIDDTIVDTSKSFDNVIKKYNINFTKKYKDVWTPEERNFIFGNYLNEILVGATIMKDVKNITDYLNSLGHELIIITARNNKYCESIEDYTKKFIKREQLNISKIYFRQRKKSGLAKKLKIDLMIDDDRTVYNNMLNDGIDCILFGDKMKTWKEVLEYIIKKEE